jgi:hypothetical protein
MNMLTQDLTSALSKLSREFSDDSEMFHLAVSLVFSSLFNFYNHKVIIVGGQASAYWLRMAGSQDVDFVTPDFDFVQESLLSVGFETIDNTTYRLLHKESNALIELVGESVTVMDITSTEFAEVSPSDVTNPLVQSFMKASGFVIDPTLVFLNYLDSSCESSLWFDYRDDGTLSLDRARALWEIYPALIEKTVCEMIRCKVWKPTEDQLSTLKHSFPKLYTTLIS